MPLNEAGLREAEFKRVFRVKQRPEEESSALGPAMVDFFKQTVKKRQTRLAKIAECFGRLTPQMLVAHCSLESLHRGSLTVLVDSASHLYELKQLLLAGLEKQLLYVCKSAGLRKIVLKPGRWYEEDEGDRKVRFK